MHFVVSWDISAEGEEWTRLNEQMKSKISSYSWVRPLTTLYVVQVGGQSDWSTILTELQTVGKAYSPKISFIVTPLMSGGQYNGMLPPNLWDELNKRSQ